MLPFQGVKLGRHLHTLRLQLLTASHGLAKHDGCLLRQFAPGVRLGQPEVRLQRGRRGAVANLPGRVAEDFFLHRSRSDTPLRPELEVPGLLALLVFPLAIQQVSDGRVACCLALALPWRQRICGCRLAGIAGNLVHYRTVVQSLFLATRFVYRDLLGRWGAQADRDQGTDRKCDPQKTLDQEPGLSPGHVTVPHSIRCFGSTKIDPKGNPSSAIFLIAAAGQGAKSGSSGCDDRSDWGAAGDGKHDGSAGAGAGHPSGRPHGDRLEPLAGGQAAVAEAVTASGTRPG